MNSNLLKRTLPRKIIIIELIGIFIIIILSLLDEIFDIPHCFFSYEHTPVNWAESLFETSILFCFGILILLITIHLLKKIRYLEGLLLVCMYCKKIKINKNWLPLENCVIDNPDTEFSYGLCPQCIEQHYTKIVGLERIKKIMHNLQNDEETKEILN